jgi:hypothetical protein
VDFIDHTPSYRGRTITLRLAVRPDPVIVSGPPPGWAPWKTLRDLRGGGAYFYGYGRDEARLDVFVLIPAGLDVPAARPDEWVTVTFRCKDGDLKHGNVATEIWR